MAHLLSVEVPPWRTCCARDFLLRCVDCHSLALFRFEMAVNSILQRFGLRHVRPLPASTSVRPGSVSALLLGGVQPAQGISSLLGNRLGPSVVPQTVLSLPTSLHAVPMRGMKHEDLSGLNSQVCAILGGQWVTRLFFEFGDVIVHRLSMCCAG